MKEHNTDYLSTDSLIWQPRLGIHAANIAQEFGVAETRAFVEILEKNNQNSLLDDFLCLSYDSKKWSKWMLNETSASKKDKSIIAGHYIFSSEEFYQIKKEAEKQINGIDEFLKLFQILGINFLSTYCRWVTQLVAEKEQTEALSPI